MRELSSMGAITVRYPDFALPRSVGLKCDLLAVGGKLRIDSSQGGTDPRPRTATSVGPALCRQIHSPDIGIGSLARVHESITSPGKVERRTAVGRKRHGFAFPGAGKIDSPNAVITGLLGSSNQDRSAVRSPNGTGGMAVIEGNPLGKALRLQIYRKVEDIEITRERSSTHVANKGQMSHIRGEGRIDIVVVLGRKSYSSLLTCFY
jgi:hypothetical protein